MRQLICLKNDVERRYWKEGKMAKILIAGAGGAPSEGVIYSLLQSKEKEQIIGMGSVPTDLVMSRASEKYVMPWAYEESYHEKLISLLEKVHPDFVYFANDVEIYYASKIRDDILKTGTKIFMPDHDVIDICVDKWKSYLAFKNAGIKVPENMTIHNEADLKEAFEKLSDKDGMVWFRAASMGGGGKGSLPTNSYEMAQAWIDRYNGWGDFLAAEMLTPNTVTWMSIWYEGELIVAQTRKRSGWIHGSRTVSGITGVTKVGITYSDELVTRIAMDTVHAVSNKPHGIFGVDMAYNADGIPNPTEINISRFFTTIRFFTEAGLNMPLIYKDLGMYGKKPELDKILNPLPDGLMWLRAMDTEPVLTTKEAIEKKLLYVGTSI